jgi:phosphoenolpyruvate carboxylase
VRVGVSAAVTRRIEEYRTLLPGAPGLTPARHDRMPYRVFFGQIGERLKATYEGRPNAYQSPDELLADVALAAESLGKMGYRRLLSMDGGIRVWRENGYPLTDK